ncbi:two-component response regulator ORR41-like [Elaeis guineensis]|uniref:Two-component response regulator ORR41-like n=1 Tax=Elaeis guineensis var. tenera TaxID=51953 RepID=A0A6J0PMN6_ELAGV|nr:two-component response regulator ORR41-like [Elaeis guineensis]
MNSMHILLHQPPMCFYRHSSTSILCPPTPLARIWFSLHHDSGRASMGSTRRRVLLVEDVEINRVVVRRLVSELNVMLEEAENGKIAVDFIKQGRTYDLIFMDKEMPVMNGLEATKQLRSLGVTTPIIALSGDCLPCDRDLFIHAGANAFQAKPLSKIELVRILTEYGLSISHA